MKFIKKEHTKRVIIEFNTENKDINIEVYPSTSKPTEIIQILMLSINVINDTLQKELAIASDKKNLKKRTKKYIT